MIYQMHKYHGKHIAYTPQEAQANNKLGWRDVEEIEFYAVPEEKQKILAKIKSGEIDPERDALVAEYVQVIGEKPHHKTSKSNLRLAIDEAKLNGGNE